MMVESPKAKAKVMSSFKGQSVASGSSNEVSKVKTLPYELH